MRARPGKRECGKAPNVTTVQTVLRWVPYTRRAAAGAHGIVMANVECVALEATGIAERVLKMRKCYKLAISSLPVGTRVVITELADLSRLNCSNDFICKFTSVVKEFFIRATAFCKLRRRA